MSNNISLKEYLSEVNQLLATQDYEKVLSHGRHILQHFPKNLAAYQMVATALLKKSRFDEAEQVYLRLLSADPTNLSVHVGLSDVYRNKQQIINAIWHLERALEQSPNNLNIANALLDLYRQRHGAAPSRLQMTRVALAKQYAKSGMFEQAAAELRRVLQENPNRLDVLVMLMEAMWNADRQHDAAEVALQILQRLPDCLAANKLLARYWILQHRPEDARPFLQRVEALAPYESLRILYHTVDPSLAVPEGTFTLPKLSLSAEGASAAFVSEASLDWFDDLGAAFEGVEVVESPDVEDSPSVPEWVSQSRSDAEDLPEWYAPPTSQFGTGTLRPQTGTLSDPEDWYADLSGTAELVQSDTQAQPEPASDDEIEAMFDSFFNETADQDFSDQPQTDTDDWLASLDEPTLMPESSEEDFDWLTDDLSAASSPADLDFLLDEEPSGLTDELGDIFSSSETQADATDDVDLDELRDATRPPSPEEVAALMAAVQEPEVDTQRPDTSEWLPDVEEELDWAVDETDQEEVFGRGGTDGLDELAQSDEELIALFDDGDDFDALFGESEDISDVEASSMPDWLAQAAPTSSEVSSASDFDDLFGETVTDDDELSLDELFGGAEPRPDTELDSLFGEEGEESDFDLLFGEEAEPSEDFGELFGEAEASSSEWLGETGSSAEGDIESLFGADEEPDFEALFGEEAEPSEDFGELFGEAEAPSSEWLGETGSSAESDIESLFGADEEPDFEALFGEEAEPSEDYGELFGEAEAPSSEWLGETGLSAESDIESLFGEEEALDFGDLLGESEVISSEWLEESASSSELASEDAEFSQLFFEAEGENRQEDSGAIDLSELLMEDEPEVQSSGNDLPDWLRSAESFEEPSSSEEDTIAASMKGWATGPLPSLEDEQDEIDILESLAIQDDLTDTTFKDDTSDVSRTEVSQKSTGFQFNKPPRWKRKLKDSGE